MAQHKKYIAKSEFHTYLYNYDARTGLIQNREANTNNCPAGRVLCETGKRLRPGINPGVSVDMISVYDETSRIRGFIQANVGIFQIYDPTMVDVVKRDAEVEKQAKLALVEAEQRRVEEAVARIELERKRVEEQRVEEQRAKEFAECARLTEIEELR